jgi:hypothetical protein
MSLHPAHGDVYLIQHYVIKFVSDLRQVSGFLWVLCLIHQLNWPQRHNWNIVVKLTTLVVIDTDLAFEYIKEFL